MNTFLETEIYILCIIFMIISDTSNYCETTNTKYGVI